MNKGRPRKLTDIELRWIKLSYEPNKLGVRRLAQQINEGRRRANVEPISRMAVFRATKSVNKNVKASTKSVTKTGNNVTVEE